MAGENDESSGRAKADQPKRARQRGQRAQPKGSAPDPTVAPEPAAAEWLLQALDLNLTATAFSDLSPRHIERLRTLCADYLTLLASDSELQTRLSFLRKLDRRFTDFGNESAFAVLWMRKLIAAAQGLARQADLERDTLVALWEVFSQCSISLDADALEALSDADSSTVSVRDVSAGMHAVTTVLFALNEGTDGEDEMSRVVDAICSAFEWEFGCYWEVNGEHLRCRVQTRAPSPRLEESSTHFFPKPSDGALGAAWSTGDIVNMATSSLEPGQRTALIMNADLQRVICLPIRFEETVCGVLEFLTSNKNELSHLGEDMLRNISVLISGSIERINRVRAMEAMASDSEAVSRVLHGLNGATNALDAVSAALATTCDAFDFEWGAYQQLDENETLRTSVRHAVRNADFLDAATALALSPREGLSGRACQSKTLVTLQNMGDAADPRSSLAQKYGVQGALAIPLVSRGEISGTIEFFSRRPLSFGEGRIRALKSVAGALSSTIERLFEREAFARSLTEFANELSSVSGSLRATTSEQSASAQELASAVQEVTATLSELRETSTEALKHAESVIGQAEGAEQTSSSGRDSVQNAILSMRDIQGQVSEIAERILQLSDQTSQIGNIIATVNEISAQSKLLALNASIEAARAGDHGKGFGVVASEIRSLAEQSREATGQVREILGEIQAGTNSAVVSAEEGTKKAQYGMSLAETSGDKIRALTESIKQSSTSARLIANSSRQQNTGIEQVTHALLSISNATNSTAEGLKETDQASARLVRMAERMALLVSGIAETISHANSEPLVDDSAAE